MPDMPGPAATGNDTDFTLSIEDVAERYALAGHPRTIRTLQRYCASGHLDCRKAATALGDKYLITDQSVTRHIAQIAELAVLGVSTAGRDASRQAAPEHPSLFAAGPERQDATGRDTTHGESSASSADAHTKAQEQDRTVGHSASRQVATGERADGHRLEAEVDRLRDDISFLRQQISTKDEQIAALLERDKETNFLVRGLQQMLTPLLSSSQNRTTDQAQSSY